MTHLSLPCISFGITALLAGSAVTLVRPAAGRRPAIISALVSLLAFALAALEVHHQHGSRLLDAWVPWLEADALDAVPMVFFASLTLVLITLAPRRDTGGSALSGMLLLAAATEIAYAASNLITLATGWWLTAVPFAFRFFGNPPARRVVSVFLIGGALALTGAIAALHATALTDFSHVSHLAMWLIVLAVALRKGLFPLHSWVVTSFEHGPLLPTALLFNGHLGALLIARSEAVTLPHFAHQVLDMLSIAALITALIASLRSFAEKKPRRLLAFVCISQASFILAGLATANAEGITGALVHWLVVTAASSGLIAIVRILEVRVMDVTNPESDLGLAVKAPRLATFFLICGLALIGLPGTLGYCAEDLLFHGALASHPFLGVALLVATAFNAINLIRLYSLLFLGVLPKHVIDIPDALPRERWPLTACVVFLVLGGILPGRVIPWRDAAAHEIETAIGLKKHGGHH
ncbi:MAG: NAD(P)H-quinone oxidoreductase subunit 2, chloroplastic [Prosthecobacter sp.]|nr:NAD(P)H-quinone oxidoreductase subunit 2, chloroplastic [Prosthecobacter sp.]